MGGFSSTPTVHRINNVEVGGRVVTVCPNNGHTIGIHKVINRSSVAVHPQLAGEVGKVADAVDKNNIGREIKDQHDVNGAMVDYYTVHLPEPAHIHGWGYLQNGQDWCLGGNEQSPIDICTGDVIPSPAQFLKVFWNKNPITGSVVDNGHTLMLNGPVSRCVGVNDRRISELFEAIQLHFHDPSEHLVNGKSYPVEMHIVHTLIPDHFDEGVKRSIAVIGIFFEIDDSFPPNAFIDSLCLDNVGVEISIIPQQLLGKIQNPEFFAYKGSLTTPPCSEIVNWYVLVEPLKITSEQHNLFASRWIADAKFSGGHGNNRVVQPLSGREVFRGNCTCPMHQVFA